MENKLLKVTGIIMIIGGAIAILISLIGLLGLGLLAALEVDLGLYTVALLISIAGAVVQLIAGIMGTKNAANPEKAQACIIACVLVVVLSLVGNILTVVSGNDFPFVGMILGLVLPALYLIGAFQLKKSAEVQQ